MNVKAGDTVHLKENYAEDFGDFWLKGTAFEIIKEYTPDMWELKDPQGKFIRCTNLFLQEKFELSVSKKTVPLPKSLEKWYRETKAHNG